MLDLAQKLGFDICIRCDGVIATLREFSVDHKEAWNGNLERFWDVRNVGFSHLSCNSRHGLKVRTTGPLLEERTPEGTRWCGGHKAFIPTSAFRANPQRHGWCRACRAVYNRRRDRKPITVS
jgi:hypothetical protein